MSSWSLLTALSGCAFSAPEKELRFRPRINQAAFRALFSTGTSWGTYSQRNTEGRLEAEIAVRGGNLEVGALRVPFAGPRAKVASRVKASAEVENGEARVRFASPVRLAPGDRIAVTVA
jgi:hypothetical protein